MGDLVPKPFTNCVNRGGKVITKVISKKKGTYMHICYIGGKSYPGEVKTKKKSKAFKELIVFAKNTIKELMDLKGHWNDR